MAKCHCVQAYAPLALRQPHALHIHCCMQVESAIKFFFGLCNKSKYIYLYISCHLFFMKNQVGLRRFPRPSISNKCNILKLIKMSAF